MSDHATSAAEPKPPASGGAKLGQLAEPSSWPAALAFGTTLTVWGLLAARLLFAIGLFLTGMALTGWVRELCKAKGRAGGEVEP